jgi:hypothetical protein
VICNLCYAVFKFGTIKNVIIIKFFTDIVSDAVESSLVQFKVLLNNISGQVLCKLHKDMKLKYNSCLSIHGFWENITFTEWPDHLR